MCQLQIVFVLLEYKVEADRTDTEGLFQRCNAMCLLFVLIIADSQSFLLPLSPSLLWIRPNSTLCGPGSYPFLFRSEEVSEGGRAGEDGRSLILKIKSAQA